MASRNKFEELLEYVVNGEQAKAEELFHALVVEKSREIYESLIEDELSSVELEEEADEEEDESVEESMEDDEEEDESVDEAMDAEEDESVDEAMEDEEMGADAADDMMGDVEAGDDMDHDEGSEEARISDLEDALEDLKAQFEKLMSDEESEPEHHDGENDPDFGGEDDEDEDEEEDESMMPAFEEEIESIDLSPAEMMREYVDKIGEPYKGGKVAGSSEASGTNTKSTVAKKNDMGGTTANIAKGGVVSEKGTKGGLLDPTTKPQDGGNVNVPGAKNATKLSAVSKGHGAEKKGTGEAGGTNTKSLFK